MPDFLLASRGQGLFGVIVLLVASFALDLFRIERRIRALRKDEGLQSADALRHVALEHRIRLYSILQGALRSILGQEFAARLLSEQWSWIWGESYRIGYAAGIANGTEISRPAIEGRGYRQLRKQLVRLVAG